MILDELSNSARKRVENLKREKSFEKIKAEALKEKPYKESRFYDHLNTPGLSFICEVKKASPSKGIIAEQFAYMQIAGEYEKAGADALSVLTEPTRFLGKDEYLTQISKKANLPVLRKDFIVDPYQIYESRLIGARAILLIAAILGEDELKEYLKIAGGLGLDVLTEVHTKEEAQRAVKAGADIIGVNNRNLKDFKVDLETAGRLREYIPDDVLFVAESGIRTREDVKRMEDAKADALLIGETFMRSADKKQTLDELRG